MTFKLFLSKKAAGFLERISNDDKRRIVEKLKLLEGNPYILPYNSLSAGICKILYNFS